MKFDTFDASMRVFETRMNERVLADDYVVLRLDGRGFTKMTKEVLNFTRPFDDRFHLAMVQTCEHLMTTGMDVTLCYTQSDEISLLLKPSKLPFGGKTRKLNSVFAGEASARFSLALDYLASFDCRVIPLPKDQHVVDYFRWRAEDAKRNGLTAFCYWGLRAQGKTAAQADAVLHQMPTLKKHALLAGLGIDFESEPDWKRLGEFLVWKTVPHTGKDPRTGTNVETSRRRLQWLNPTPQGKEISELVQPLLMTEVQ